MRKGINPKDMSLERLRRNSGIGDREGKDETYKETDFPVA